MAHQQYPTLSLDPASVAESDPAIGATNIKAYEFKGFMFSMLTMCLKQTGVHAIEQQLTKELAKLPDFFSEPLVLDLHDIALTETAPDFSALFTMMRGLNLTPVGICNGNEIQRAAARAAGVPTLAGGSVAKRRSAAVDNRKEQHTQAGQGEGTSAAHKPQITDDTSVTHIIHTPVRTGQRVFSKGDITLLAGVNSGAEVLAVGSIHAYGPLRGRALAGVAGDDKARIFTQSMEAELVSIAGNFRVLENELGPDLQGKPAQIYLEGERIVIKPL